jgi:hypothetical protein
MDFAETERRILRLRTIGCSRIESTAILPVAVWLFGVYVENPVNLAVG